jgi:hypothetical protein
MTIAVGNRLINMSNITHIEIGFNIKIHFIGSGETLTLTGADSEWFLSWAQREIHLCRFVDITAPPEATHGELRITDAPDDAPGAFHPNRYPED